MPGFLRFWIQYSGCGASIVQLVRDNDTTSLLRQVHSQRSNSIARPAFVHFPAKAC